MAHIEKMLTLTAHGADKTGDTFHFQHYADESGAYQVSQDVHGSGGSATCGYTIQGRMTDEHQWSDIVAEFSLNSSSAAQNAANTLQIFPQMRVNAAIAGGHTVTAVVTIYS